MTSSTPQHPRPLSSVSEKQHSYQIFNQISKTYDRLNHILSFGIDFYWRHKLSSYLPRAPRPLRVLDLATGTGDLALCLGRKPDVQEVVGIDLSEGMIALGKDKVQRRGLAGKIKLLIGDGVSIPMPDESFHVVTTSFGIRNFPDPQTSLQNMHRILKPGGRAIIMEFSLPSPGLLRALYLFYFRTILPRIGNILSGHKNAYTYLNQTVENFPYGQEFLDLMKKANFQNLREIRLSGGIASIYIGDKRE